MGEEKRWQKSLRIGVHHANGVVWGPVPIADAVAREPARRKKQNAPNASLGARMLLLTAYASAKSASTGTFAAAKSAYRHSALPMSMSTNAKSVHPGAASRPAFMTSTHRGRDDDDDDDDDDDADATAASEGAVVVDARSRRASG